MNSLLLLASVMLSWDMNTETNLGGYKVHCGTESGKPVASLNVGKIATWNADNFLKSQTPGTKLYFVVTAYNTENKEGNPTNEVSYLVPQVLVPPHSHSWDEITGKPEAYPNQPHTHPIPTTETGVGK